MQKNKKSFIAILFFLSLGIPSEIFSQNNLNDDDLKGFDTIALVVEPLNPVITGTGLAVDQIQTDVEIKIRRAGLKVQEANSNLSPFIYLYIRVTAVDADSARITGSINTSLRQRVRLDRDKSIVFVADTWEVGDTFIAWKRNPSSIRDMISDQVDRFISAYLKANGQNDSSTSPPLPTTKQQDDSPFTATYVGGNKQPEVEVVNDSNRTLYLDLGQEKMVAYTIPSGESKKIPLTEGYYNFKASAVRVRTLTGRDLFSKGYSYTWRFTIITVPR
jgi:hypothetical protein